MDKNNFRNERLYTNKISNIRSNYYLDSREDFINRSTESHISLRKKNIDEIFSDKRQLNKYNTNTDTVILMTLMRKLQR